MSPMTEFVKRGAVGVLQLVDPIPVAALVGLVQRSVGQDTGSLRGQATPGPNGTKEGT